MSYTSDWFTLFVASGDRVVAPSATSTAASYQVQINAPFLLEERNNPDVYYECYLDRFHAANANQTLCTETTDYLQISLSFAQPFSYTTGSSTLKHPTFIVPYNSYARASPHPVIVSKQSLNGLLRVDVYTDVGTPITAVSGTNYYEHVMQLVFKRVHNLPPGL